MRPNLNRSLAVVGWLGLLALSPSLLTAAPPKAASSSPRRILTRVFFQDDDARALKWADVLAGEPPQLGTVSSISGFPTLDVKRQSLVQMKAAAGMLLVGVRDDDDGAFQSGWILIDSGVAQEEHGDHSHWTYPRVPAVRAMQLDNQQGNPAHLYCYDEVFYLANDKLDGFTRLDPAAILPADNEAAVRRRAALHRGGGGHITLAAADGKVAYSTWIDREGPNKGRVDVTLLQPSGNSQFAYSFHLPHGGIHGAISCQGKVFFAPADGLCWVTANADPKLDPKSVAVQHLSLGKDGEKPRRTGSFHSLGRFVGFSSGAGPTAAACFLDAGRSTVEIVTVPLGMAEGSRPVGPVMVKPRKGPGLAFVFHDHPDDVEGPHKLSLLEINSGADGSLGNVKVVAVTDVGRSRPEGHSGHHDLAIDGDRRRAVFTNPGDGTLTLFSLVERKSQADFKVGGMPSKIVCFGGAGKAD